MTQVKEIVDGGLVPDSGFTAEEWFAEQEEGDDVPKFVAILGPQASGKSTLCNVSLGTAFKVGSVRNVGSATTKGIDAGLAADNSAVAVLDIEGSDGRERGRKGKAFQDRCACLAVALADVIVVNFWCHDINRFDAGGYMLLETVFREAGKNVVLGMDAMKTGLVFAVRDADEETEGLTEIIKEDANELWAVFNKEAELGDWFEISVEYFPNYKHRTSEFEQAAKTFGAKLTDPSVDGYLCKPEFSKGVPADSCLVFMRGIWDSHSSAESALAGIEANREAADGEEDNLFAAYRVNESFSEARSAAQTKIDEFGEGLDEGEKIEGLGTKMDEVVTEALALFDDSADEFVDEPIFDRKRRELTSILDTSLHGLFLKQIQLLRENAMAHFKSATSSEDMPSDFAFFTADSLFSREAEESKRLGAGWSFNNERTDLQNMMQEISTQRKRLLTSQATSAQQHANAMQYLQVQQAHMQAMQQQQYGGSAGQWNIGAAYRPPDTNINASLSYQQGRTNIQISMVPDESASLLGPNGFTSGLLGGNLGLSLNMNV